MRALIGRRTKARAARSSKPVRRARTMARRRGRYARAARRSYSRGLGIGKGFLMSGFLGGGTGIKGVAKSAMVGVGAAVASQYIPINSPWKEEIAAAAAGGAPGLIAAFLMKQTGATGAVNTGGY